LIEALSTVSIKKCKFFKKIVIGFLCSKLRNFLPFNLFYAVIIHELFFKPDDN